jgi:hypothetical protein
LSKYPVLVYYLRAREPWGAVLEDYVAWREPSYDIQTVINIYKWKALGFVNIYEEIFIKKDGSLYSPPKNTTCVVVEGKVSAYLLTQEHD